MRLFTKITILTSLLSFALSLVIFQTKTGTNPVVFIKELRGLAEQIGYKNMDDLDSAVAKGKKAVKDIASSDEKCTVIIRGQYLPCRADNTYLVNGETIYFVPEENGATKSSGPSTRSVASEQALKNIEGLKNGEKPDMQGVMDSLKEAQQNMRARNKMLKELGNEDDFRKRQ